MILKITSPKMHCDGCRKNIKKALKHLKGVKINDIDLTTRKIIVDYDVTKIAPEDILAKLASIDYPSTIDSNNE